MNTNKALIVDRVSKRINGTISKYKMLDMVSEISAYIKEQVEKDVPVSLNGIGTFYQKFTFEKKYYNQKEDTLKSAYNKKYISFKTDESFKEASKVMEEINNEQ